jgi:hypothetical protein
MSPKTLRVFIVKAVARINMEGLCKSMENLPARSDQPRTALTCRSHVLVSMNALGHKFSFESVRKSGNLTLGSDAVPLESGADRRRLEAVRQEMLLRSIQKERY